MPKKTPRMSKSFVTALGISAAGLMIVTVLFLFDPSGSAVYPVCLFHKLTGLNCPGCGSLRALHHLTHGELAAAFRCNPLLIISLPVLVLGMIRGQVAPSNLRSRPFRFVQPAVAWAICFIVILFGVLRNVPGPTFAWMSP